MQNIFLDTVFQVHDRFGCSTYFYNTVKHMAMKLSSFIVVVMISVTCVIQAAEQNISTDIASIGSVSTDGSDSISNFRFSLESSTDPSQITIQTEIALSLSLTPQAVDLSKVASIYAVISTNNQFYALNPDGEYTYWNGSIETLVPFKTDQVLTEEFTLKLMSGVIETPANYFYYAAYQVENDPSIHFTPNPARLTVADSAEVLDVKRTPGAIAFDNSIEKQIIQARCIACHVDGGLARSSGLIFERSNNASSLNNFSALADFIRKNGSDYLLEKVSGGNGHVGGVQLSIDSSEYQEFENIVTLTASGNGRKSYIFELADGGVTERQLSFLSGLASEPLTTTLRRATLLLHGRVPTSAEIAAVRDDEDLRIALRRLMEGDKFREFVVTAVNDKLLTRGKLGAVNVAFGNYLNLSNKDYEIVAAVADQTDSKQINDARYHFRNSFYQDLQRTSGELVYHVINNDLPYSEILTADYMMMNPLLDEVFDGDATFVNTEDRFTFKPSKIRGFFADSNIRELEKDSRGNRKYEAVGPALSPFPHAGLLTDFAFLDRYPTTDTNRNRARARWTFYHFLGIDIDKTSQRTTDADALADRNNPTMNNPNCTVCHALLDPVAGAFQNWERSGRFREGRLDTLTGTYKYPEDGGSLYQEGDLWYRDMRPPGLFGTAITERDKTLSVLADLIVAEEGFLSASVMFWWSAIFGKPLILKPVVETDENYSARYEAYLAQQQAIDGFSKSLEVSMSAKDMLVAMLMSPWFSSETASGLASESAQSVVSLGNKQLLTPEQLARKTESLTSINWRGSIAQKAQIENEDGPIMIETYETLGVLLGGIDSDAVTERVVLFTPTMLSVLMTHATEVSCMAVVKDFSKEIRSRKLFDFVEESSDPNTEDFRKQIRHLYSLLHGSDVGLFSDQVERMILLYSEAKKRGIGFYSNTSYYFTRCQSGWDGNIIRDLQNKNDGFDFDIYDFKNNGQSQKIVDNIRNINTALFLKQIDPAAPQRDNVIDWEVYGPVEKSMFFDRIGAKYAWIAVMSYMLSHLDFVHE